MHHGMISGIVATFTLIFCVQDYTDLEYFNLWDDSNTDPVIVWQQKIDFNLTLIMLVKFHF